MRPEELERITDNIMYNRAQVRLSRTKSPEMREQCLKIIKAHQEKYKINFQLTVMIQNNGRE